MALGADWTVKSHIVKIGGVSLLGARPRGAEARNTGEDPSNQGKSDDE
jgi:hypothetical protein